VPSSSLLDCLGRVRRVKAKSHAVASRALTRQPRPEGWQLSRRPGEDQSAAISAGRTMVRRAISVPLAPVTSGLSRSLADTPPRRSGHVTGSDGTDSQADSAGSIPVTRSNTKAQVRTTAPEPGPCCFTAATAFRAISVQLSSGDERPGRAIAVVGLVVALVGRGSLVGA